mmetsp:Transcript_35508/g.52016  ORF Transcript_35508/g.52016 Transcript_35508/m.52016 type:complete len:144 (-) Transcript_35508:1369-1800(-)
MGLNECLKKTRNSTKYTSARFDDGALKAPLLLSSPPTFPCHPPFLATPFLLPHTPPTTTLTTTDLWKKKKVCGVQVQTPECALQHARHCGCDDMASDKTQIGNDGGGGGSILFDALDGEGWGLCVTLRHLHFNVVVGRCVRDT